MFSPTTMGMMDTLMTTLVEGEDYIFKEEKGEVWLTTKGAKAAEKLPRYRQPLR